MAIDRQGLGNEQMLRRARRIIVRARGCGSDEAGRRKGRIIEADLRRLIGDLRARAGDLDHAMAAAARRVEAASAYKRCYRLIRK
jgi:hypothetical protein